MKKIGPMKVGEIWEYNPSIHIDSWDGYQYFNRVKITKMWETSDGQEMIKIELEDGRSARSMDGQEVYSKKHFLDIYTKVY